MNAAKKGLLHLCKAPCKCSISYWEATWRQGGGQYFSRHWKWITFFSVNCCAIFHNISLRNGDTLEPAEDALQPEDASTQNTVGVYTTPVGWANQRKLLSALSLSLPCCGLTLLVPPLHPFLLLLACIYMHTHVYTRVHAPAHNITVPSYGRSIKQSIILGLTYIIQHTQQ